MNASNEASYVIEFSRPLLGVTLPVQVLGVKSGASLLVNLPGPVEVEITLLGITVPDVANMTPTGPKLCEAGRKAQDVAYQLVNAHRTKLCAYFPEPPFDRGWILGFRTGANLGAVLFLDDTRTLQAELVAAGVAKPTEDDPWLTPQASWPTALSRVNVNSRATRPGAKAAA